MRRSKRVLLVQLFSFYLLSVSQTSASIFSFITNSLYLNFFKLCTSFVFTQDTKIVTGLTALIFGLSVNVFISLLYTFSNYLHLLCLTDIFLIFSPFPSWSLNPRPIGELYRLATFLTLKPVVILLGLILQNLLTRFVDVSKACLKYEPNHASFY